MYQERSAVPCNHRHTIIAGFTLCATENDRRQIVAKDLNKAKALIEDVVHMQGYGPTLS